VIDQYLKSVPTQRDLAHLGPDSPIPSTRMRAPRDAAHINVRLADFGQACYYPQRDYDDRQGHLLLMRAPEVILGLPWDTKVDIWNAGCLVSCNCCEPGRYGSSSDLEYKDLGDL